MEQCGTSLSFEKSVWFFFFFFERNIRKYTKKVMMSKKRIIMIKIKYHSCLGQITNCILRPIFFRKKKESVNSIDGKITST